MTFRARLRTEGLSAPCVFDGAVNVRCFQAWVERFPAPTLKNGDTVIRKDLRDSNRSPRRHCPIVAIGSGDEGEPTITIVFPEDD